MGKSDSTHIKSVNSRFEQHGTNQVTQQVMVLGQTGAMSNKHEVRETNSFLSKGVMAYVTDTDTNTNISGR